MHSQTRWYDEVSFPVTVCDRDGIILEMNRSSIAQFENDGGAALIGKSLVDCHPEPFRSMLINMLAHPIPHTYVSQQNGKTSVNHETPWFMNGEYQGFVEISVELPNSIQIKGN